MPAWAGMRNPLVFPLVVAILLFVGSSAVATASSRAVGTLDIDAALRLTSTLGACPAGASGNTCATRTISGQFPGLGAADATYTWVADIGPPSCSDPVSGKALAYGIRLAIVGKGEIELTTSAGSDCVGQEAVRTQTQAFTITGGTGIYAGASGSGTLAHVLGAPTDSGGRSGTQTWTGTLAVPGLEFDTTPPTIMGATNKTVRAKKGRKRARVVFRVTAQDDRDATVAVACTPKSGSRFKIGRRRVTCRSTDSSGNTASAAFTVRVKRSRR